MKRILYLLSLLAVAALAACGADAPTEQGAVDPDSPLVTVYSSPA